MGSPRQISARLRPFDHFRPGYKIRSKLTDYRIIRQLTKTDSYRLFLGTTSTGSLRAIKLFHPESMDPIDEKYKSEIGVLRDLRGTSGLPLFYEAGVHSARISQKKVQFPFYVSDFGYGRSLDKFEIPENIKPRFMLDILYQVARTLYDVHNKSFLHLGVTRENILQKWSGETYLMGFSNSVPKSTVRNFDYPLKDIAYTAPEQVLPKGVIDVRTDIYKLGITIAAIFHHDGFTPENPHEPFSRFKFEHNFEPGFSREHCGSHPLLNKLEDIVRKMTRTSKDQRYQSMKQVLEETDPLYQKFPVPRQLVQLGLEEFLTDALDPILSEKGFAKLVREKYGIIVVEQGTFDQVKDPSSYHSKCTSESFRPPVKGTIRWKLGRSRTADIVLLDMLNIKTSKENISREQAEIVYDHKKDEYSLTNLSSNGTYLCNSGIFSADDQTSFELLGDMGQSSELVSGAVFRCGKILWEFFTPEDVRGFILENQTDVEDSNETHIFKTRPFPKPKNLQLDDSSVVL